MDLDVTEETPTKALVFKPKLAKRYRLHHNSTSQITEHNNHFYKTIGGNLSLL